MHAPISRIPLLLTALLIIAAQCVACSTKETLDKQVDALVKCFQDNDYEAFKSASSSALVKEVPQRRFAIWSAIFQELGSFKERTMEGIKVESSQKQGNYKLEFEAGDVDLRLNLDGDIIIGFELTGSTWEDAAEAAMLKFEKSQPPPTAAPNPAGP